MARSGAARHGAARHGSAGWAEDYGSAGYGSAGRNHSGRYSVSRPGRMSSRVWSRLRLFEAAGWRCARCCRPGALELHHVDHDRTNNTDDNLEVLCRSCHIRHHKRTPEAQAWAELVDRLL